MKFITTIALAIIFSMNCFSQRTSLVLNKDWKFINEDVEGAHHFNYNDSKWENVSVPHDWAIYGPFSKEIDKQVVAITQNGEKQATEKTGRTGALPHIGVGWYRKSFDLEKLSDQQKVLLQFDGAMSNAEVFVNGKKVGNRPYGYSYFYFDITEEVMEGKNLVAVRLENSEFASRWYPGAGLYRKVTLEIKNKECFQKWGTFVTTPFISDELAQVNIKAAVTGSDMRLVSTIIDTKGQVVSKKESTEQFGELMEQNLSLNNPTLWSPENPNLYHVKCQLYKGHEMVDEQSIRFGVRDVKYEAGVGFSLNGQVRKFKGVCLHHDLGPLGAAINRSALRRQLQILKDMGCDAIRSSHNMPSIEQLELCDEMGFLFLAESFDEWAKAKIKNGYNLRFNEWAEKDVVNLVRATRNHPCIVMWSSGNEVPDQWGTEGVKRAKWLQDIFHREDPTRPVTVGMDQVKAVMATGFGAITDVPGLNYRVHLYEEAFERFPQGMILGSETASTISSRGVYKFPVEEAKMTVHDDLQCSSYDLESCNWSNIPDEDFAMQEDKPWVIGQFVWTGFDYLGEPTPYDDYWPSRSSYFGICDLAGLPKDRYYMYRSIWNEEDETLHILPHWNWKGREGETTPVFVYTSYNRAELFVNGKSQGVKEKDKNSRLDRYRLRWMDVKYEPGTIKVVALDENNKPLAEKEIHTAGKPYQIELSADRTELTANGEDISYITVSVHDRQGNLCPKAANALKFKVSGAGEYRAACNGDATSLEMFHQPHMKLFNGKLVILVKSTEKAGDIKVNVSGKGLKTANLMLKAKK
jgi:beta-galactosidase